MTSYSQHVKISGFWALLTIKTMNITYSLKNLKEKIKLRNEKLESKLFFKGYLYFFQLLLALQTQWNVLMLPMNVFQIRIWKVLNQHRFLLKQ